jgi:hypothetical protein
MRRLVTVTLLVTAALLLPAGSIGARSELPLPAAITLVGSKAAYQIDRAEHVHRVRVHSWPFPKYAACCAAPGVWFAVRHKHLVLGRGQHVFWQAGGEYRGQFYLGTVRFGSQTVVFTYRRRLYLAPVDGPERVIGRSEIPIGFTASGFYTYTWNGDLRLRSDTGGIVKSLGRPLGRSTYTVIDGVLYFMTGQDMMAARGAPVERLVSLRALGLIPRKTWFQSVGSLLELLGGHRLVLLRGDGSIFATTALPRVHQHTEGLTGFLSPSPGLDAVAFAADSDTGRSGTETVFLLRAGAHAAVPIHTERVTFTPCVQWAALAWHGSWLLYTDTEGVLDVIDTRPGYRTLELSHLLRHRHGTANATAYWSGHRPPMWS